MTPKPLRVSVQKYFGFCTIDGKVTHRVYKAVCVKEMYGSTICRLLHLLANHPNEAAKATQMNREAAGNITNFKKAASDPDRVDRLEFLANNMSVLPCLLVQQSFGTQHVSWILYNSTQQSLFFVRPYGKSYHVLNPYIQFACFLF